MTDNAPASVTRRAAIAASLAGAAITAALPVVHGSGRAGDGTAPEAPAPENAADRSQRDGPPQRDAELAADDDVVAAAVQREQAGHRAAEQPGAARAAVEASRPRQHATQRQGVRERGHSCGYASPHGTLTGGRVSAFRAPARSFLR